MNIKAILFDLDGTLLPMDQEHFTKGYFKLLAAKMAQNGYEPQRLIDAIWAGTAAMVKNDGKRTNEEVFWDKLSQIYGPKIYDDIHLFDTFYENDFQKAKSFCGYNEDAAKAVRQAREMGYRTALATNPIFPMTAQESRLRWAGLAPSDFELCTSYENTGYCKPNPLYFADVARRMGLKPEECCMVGNDTTEDLAATKIGMQIFFLTDCLIHKGQTDISAYPQGNFSALLDFIRSLRTDVRQAH